MVLAGLKLAVEDQARGTIDRRREIELTRTMQSVIGDLSDHVEAQPGPSGAHVACVAGNGPFDEAVTAMMAQLLEARGLAVRTVSKGQTSREAIATLDLGGPAVIVVSYIELTGSPAKLRYLIRRLKARAPAARIVVGLWPQGETALSDPGPAGARVGQIRRIAGGSSERRSHGSRADPEGSLSRYRLGH